MDGVLVVGAGPAGSAAAMVLARHSVPVTLLDQAEFPRPKVCGDGIGWNTLRLLSELDIDLEGQTEALYSCHHVLGVSPSGHTYEGAFPQKNGRSRHGYVLPRQRLDHILWQKALEEGARFERFRATQPIVEDGLVRGVRGSTNGKTADRRARITIIADGATSTLARRLQPDRPSSRHAAIARRAYFEGVESRGRAEFFFNQSTLPGYAWIFPLGDGRANVGVGLRLDVARKDRVSLRKAFETFVHGRYVAARFSGAEQIGRASSGLLPLASGRVRRSYPGALIVGDAGFFVSPLTGGGIYNALESGRTAAAVVHDALESDGGTYQELRRFDRHCRAAIGRQLEREAVAQRLLSVPGVLDRVIQAMRRHDRFAQFVLNVF